MTGFHIEPIASKLKLIERVNKKRDDCYINLANFFKQTEKIFLYCWALCS